MKKVQSILAVLLFIVGCSLPKGTIGVDDGGAMTSEQLVSHTGFTLLYSELHQQAKWVAYTLSKDEVYGEVARKDNYRSDPSVKTGSAELSDYKYSGYDRGHLKPAADSKISDEEMADCSFLTNISPQIHAFNAGIWVELEELVRDWAVKYDSVHVVTGPVLNNPIDVIGDNEVSVPEAFYKALLSPDSSQSIAFLLPHEDSDDELSTFVISVDSLEEVTSIDFFVDIDDSVERVALFELW